MTSSFVKLGCIGFGDSWGETVKRIAVGSEGTNTVDSEENCMFIYRDTRVTGESL